MATTGTINNDTLIGSIGNDTLIGYLGNDTYQYSLGGGLDTVRDTGGTADTLVFSDPGNKYVNLDVYRSGNNLVFDFFSAGKLTIENQFGTTAPASRIEYMTSDDGWGPFTIQNGLTGTSGADLIVGTTAAESISGGLGDDLIWGGAGNDTINGGDGNNEIHGGVGNDSLIGGVNDDEFYGGAGSDILSGGSGYDEAYYDDLTAGIFVNLSGQTQAYNNRLIGTNKVLETGTNTIDTLVSIEDVNGTNYSDYFMLGRTNSNTSVALGKGNDTLDGGSSTDTNYWTSLDYGDDPSGVIINLSRAYLTVTLGSTTYNVGRGTAKDGWDGRDTIMLYEDNLSIVGSEYADYIRGRDDTDSDRIWEWFGGGRGNDTINGGTGTSDTAGYGVDDDEGSYGVIVNLSSASITVGSLVVSAGTARDNWRNTDTLQNIENINGSRLADFIVGSSGNNGFLSGEAGNDTIKGGGGMDNLLGGAGNDSLMGETGQDYLTGGLGKDTLSGGADRDYFHFSALNESGITSTTWDVITDFTRNTSTVIGDIIDLSMIDTNLAVAGDQAFSFIGSNVFSTDATGQLRYAYNSTAGTGVLYGSTDADTAAEFALQLNGVTALSASDFIL
jgi:Ca2+-binding RTX toxin-like protein